DRLKRGRFINSLPATRNEVVRLLNDRLERGDAIREGKPVSEQCFKHDGNNGRLVQMVVAREIEDRNLTGTDDTLRIVRGVRHLVECIARKSWLRTEPLVVPLHLLQVVSNKRERAHHS